MKRVSISNIVVALILLFGGYSLGQKQGPVQAVTVSDTVAVAQYAREVADLRIENEGFRARLAGVAEVAPQRIVVTDTVVPIPDTVLVFVNVRDGVLSTEFLVSDTVPGIAAPELHTGFDVSTCDDGFEVSANGVICDRSRLGHLYVGPVLGMDPMLSAWWKPSYQSPWEVSVGRAQSQWVFSLRRGVKLW